MMHLKPKPKSPPSSFLKLSSPLRKKSGATLNVSRGFVIRKKAIAKNGRVEGRSKQKITPVAKLGIQTCCYLNELIEYLTERSGIDLKKGDIT